VPSSFAFEYIGIGEASLHFLKEQMLHYRSQLSAYAQMVARVMNVPEERVGWAILFTAIPRLVWQGK
jgi:hypothetical protein